MTEMLKRLRDKKVPVAIYYKSVGGFCAGFVRETDDEFALLELISPSGRFDGYLCIRIEEILKLDAGTAYLNNLVKVYRHYGEEPLPIKVSSRDVLREFTDVVIKNKWMCTMEIGFETLDKINGFVVGREWELVEMRLVSENGEDDGYTTFDLEEVVCFGVRSEYEKYLDTLYGLNGGAEGENGRQEKGKNRVINIFFPSRSGNNRGIFCSAAIKDFLL